MAFKKHIALFWDEDSFITLCGINEGCSEQFYDDPHNLVEFSNYGQATCKKCLSRFDKMLAEHDADFDKNQCYG